MSGRLAQRPAAVARVGAAALLVAILAATMQRSDAGLAAALTGGLAMVTAAACLWSRSSLPLWRVLALASSGLFLLAANGVAEPGSSGAYALARAAGPLALAAAAVSVLPRRTAWLAAAGGLVSGGVHLLLFDPFVDPRCKGCGHLGLAVWADADRATAAWSVGWVLLVAALLIGIRHHVVATGLLLVSAAAYATHPEQPLWLAVGVAAATMSTAEWAWRLRLRQLRLRRLLASYETTGADLTLSLRELVGDPGLTIGFPLVEPAGAEPVALVDADGEPVPEAAGSWTDIRSGHELLARINHRADLPARPELALDALTTLALYRQRATAQLAAEVRRLADRRRDIANAGLAERDRLERDLHDGVQQELLALGLDLRLAMAQRSDGAANAVGSLAMALALVHDCVDQVRTISTGISPPMLATHGLRGALGALARRRGTDLDTDGVTTERFPIEIEQAAFAALSEALANGATRVDAEREGDRLCLRADDAGSAGPRTEPAPAGSLTDLFAALGGSLVARDRHLEAWLPCAS
jgi:signal transduction histidine kinase